MRFACTIIIFVALLETTPIFAAPRYIDPVEDFRGTWKVTFWAHNRPITPGQYEQYRTKRKCGANSHALKLPTRPEIQVICEGAR